MATPRVNFSIGTPISSSNLLVPISRPATPSVNLNTPNPFQSANGLTEAQAATNYLIDLELLPDVLDLLKQVEKNKILPKDVDNEAGKIRQKLSKAKRAIHAINGLEEKVQDKNGKIDKLKIRIGKKKNVIEDFNTAVRARFSENFKKSNMDTTSTTIQQEKDEDEDVEMDCS